MTNHLFRSQSKFVCTNFIAIECTVLINLISTILAILSKGISDICSKVIIWSENILRFISPMPASAWLWQMILLSA